MLASLGLSEQEYRAFLARLSTVEVSRKEASTIEKVEAVAVAVESFAKPAAPTIKSEQNQKRSVTAKEPMINRGELFARLRRGE